MTFKLNNARRNLKSVRLVYAVISCVELGYHYFECNVIGSVYLLVCVFVTCHENITSRTHLIVISFEFISIMHFFALLTKEPQNKLC